MVLVHCQIMHACNIYVIEIIRTPMEHRLKNAYLKNEAKQLIVLVEYKL